jgi:chromosome segregation ATPase
LKNVKKTAGDTKGKEDKARLDTEAEGLQKAVDEAQKDLDESTKICKEVDGKLAESVEKSAAAIKKLTTKIEEQKKTVETAEKDAKATIVTLPGGKEEVETLEKKELEEKKTEEKTTISPTSITVTTGKKGKTTTGKPIAPAVPAPKPKEEEKPAKEGEKPKPVPVPVAPTIVKKKLLEGETVDDDDEDDGEPAEVSVTEVPGGEAQITKEVTENTLAAHNARVELVKTKGKMKYELETIKDTLAKYEETIKKTKEELKKNQETLKTEQGKLETLKTNAVTAKLKGEDRTKAEVEVTGQVTKITDLEAKITREEAALIEWQAKVTDLKERRKEIKFNVEVKVLEAKEAEAAVLEAIKTVTDVELLNRKRWLASKLVGDYKKCTKYMEEFKMIFEKQGQVIAAELADHSRRLDVASGAITALKEKKTSLADAKKTKDLEIQLEKIESEISRHEKVVTVEEKVITAVKEKKEKNTKEYEGHADKCAKVKSEAVVSSAGVNDAATTLKNQREYQVQITNLKNLLIGSHEQALSKRQEAEKILANHTLAISKYEQQTTIANEQIADSKTKIAGAQEVQRIIAVRMKEIATLLARPTIGPAEKTKLTKEEDEIKGKLEAQQNIVDTETKALVNHETNIAQLASTIKTFKKYVTDIKEVIKNIEKKVKETSQALKAKTKKDDEAPPVKGKDTEGEDAAEKDADGDDKIDEVDSATSEETEAVKGGNEKVDKELDQAEEENKSTTTQIDSLTKTITTVEEKSEIADKEVIQETTDTTKEEALIAEVKEQKVRLEKVRERKRCARLFPSVFSSFEIKQELKQENMCPCPNSGKGLTVLLLENVKDAQEYEKFFLGCFEKNLIVEGAFQAQVNRYYFGADDKVVNQEEENITMRLVCSDDKIDEVMQFLDAQNVTGKSTDLKISPLLKGKAEYQKWQQTSLAAPKANNHIHLDKMADDDLEEEPMEE